MIFGVILCCVCVISVQIEARTIKPAYIIGKQTEMKMKNTIRDENDAYGAETIQLNGRIPRAPSWPEGNSDNKKMFLLPSILNKEDQINVTGLIFSDPQWVSISLITERDGINGKEPDHNNVAGQIELHFPSNGSTEDKIVLKTITNGQTNTTIPAYLTATELIPESTSGTPFQMTITVTMVVSKSGNEVGFTVGESHVDQISLQHKFNDIRYIAIDGDVEKVKRLDFIFA